MRPQNTGPRAKCPNSHPPFSNPERHTLIGCAVDACHAVPRHSAAGGANIEQAMLSKEESQLGAWGARFSHGFEANSLPRMAAAPAEQVENCFRVALDVASEQQAKTSERRAATSLAQLWSDRGERQRSHD